MSEDTMTRRESLVALAGMAVACTTRDPKRSEASEPDSAMAIERVAPLTFPFETRDPFLFCVHHDDHFPSGNAELGPAASLIGRPLGQDFELRDGFRMYHGQKVPGFPQHPHRGFETVTVVRHGFVDHSDSKGAMGRYGQGDVQWMTAGSGILHAEMFPLLETARPNPLDLFQIWLNLPAARKMVAPEYKMLWSEQIPKRSVVDAEGRSTLVTIVAGTFDGIRPPAPPSNSWASDPNNEVGIWMLNMPPGARLDLPHANSGTNRTIYLLSGSGLRIGRREIPSASLVHLRGDLPVTLRAGAEQLDILVLQGRPIGEPVVQHGPFVMNSRDEIVRTIRDYQRTQFGGWPWAEAELVHPRERGRFARHANGHEESPV